MMMDANLPGDPSCWKTPTEIQTSNSTDAAVPSQRPDVQIKLTHKPRESFPYVWAKPSPQYFYTAGSTRWTLGGQRQKPGKASFSMWQLQACLPRPENQIAFPRLSRGGRTKQTNTPLLPTMKALTLGCAQTDIEHRPGGFQEINPCVLLVHHCQHQTISNCCGSRGNHSE